MRTRATRLGAALCLALVAAAAGAQQTLRSFDDPQQRERYYALLEELRCLVCQNQTLASSDADLAQDLRDEVYRLVVEEDRSDEAAIAFLTQRYGDFVLYRPPFRPSTWLLWLGPFAMLLAGGAVLAAIVRARRRAPAPALTDRERARAEALLAPDDAGEGPADPGEEERR